jgi:hyperosmotically inducible periplasmic protein
MKEKAMKRNLGGIAATLAASVLAVALMVGPALAAPGGLVQSVRHELVMLPYYSIFDNLAYRVDGNTVTLYGQVTRPTLKSDAERVVKRIEGVSQVVNKIEVLPLSPFDDRIRRAEYRAIFGYGPMYRYAMGANPSVHIIVDNGHVTLEGVVSNQGDKNIAGIRANGVPGVFSVTNNLQVAQGRG